MIGSKRISLDPRLSMIADMVGRCKRYADIGCDHGRLGAFLLQRGWVEEALLTDISEASLEKARKLISMLGYQDRVQFWVGDGVNGLPASVDTVVIAGMGGVTAADIIDRGRGNLGQSRLILQVNVAQAELRARLVNAGYRISEEKIVRDGRRYYVIMEAVPGTAEYSPQELHVGPVLLKTRPELLDGYVRYRLGVAKKALDGARFGSQSHAIRALEEEISIWEGALACL
ncbi:MAG: class I SAM-dependent methyltransferase [Christensenellales bacterium]|nr:class I SAM-dependent methyltransferase [Christensenellales bacterium]